MATLIITHFYERDGVPDGGDNYANRNGAVHTAVNGAGANGVTENDEEKIYQAVRNRFVALAGSEALDSDDNLAPGYESLQGIFAYPPPADIKGF